MVFDGVQPLVTLNSVPYVLRQRAYRLEARLAAESPDHLVHKVASLAAGHVTTWSWAVRADRESMGIPSFMDWHSGDRPRTAAQTKRVLKKYIHEAVLPLLVQRDEDWLQAEMAARPERKWMVTVNIQHIMFTFSR
mgnify:CR=1 FL=1